MFSVNKIDIFDLYVRVDIEWMARRLRDSSPILRQFQFPKLELNYWTFEMNPEHQDL